MRTTSDTGAFSVQLEERIHVDVEDLETDFLKIIQGAVPIEVFGYTQGSGILDWKLPE